MSALATKLCKRGCGRPATRYDECSPCRRERKQREKTRETRNRLVILNASLEVKTALTAMEVLVGSDSPMFTRLAACIAERREPKPGRPMLWVRRLKRDRFSDRDLAATILFHILKRRLSVEPDEPDDGDERPEMGDSPLVLTVGTDLGADLVGTENPDPDEHIHIGVQLLHVAKSAGVIAIPKTEGRAGQRVVLPDLSYDRFQEAIKATAEAANRQVHKGKPPTALPRTKSRRDMPIERPPLPPRVVQAAQRIQGTAWRVNKAVLERLEAPDVVAETEKAYLKFLIAKKRRRVLREQYKRTPPDMMVLEQAKKLQDVRFYFPVFTDFRGRFYQRGSLLTYTSGSDRARGLLEFADGEILDNDGMRWLSWHAAQMWGDGKGKGKGRLPSSSELPLGDGTRWMEKAITRERDPQDPDHEHLKMNCRWQDAEHPVQFLAALFALKDAHERKPVHLPVRVDASCSGLQHLALLTANEDLARLVNLWGDGEHATLDRRLRVLIEAKGDENFYQAVADKTRFERKHVKAVIMPWLYGSGEEKSARSLAAKRGKRLSKRHMTDAVAIRRAAIHLAGPPLRLRDWFEEVAAKHRGAGLPVRWTVPSGFQVIQDYRVKDGKPKGPDRQIRVPVDGRGWAKLIKRHYTDVLLWKDIALAPNIVHSLDAALLVEIVAGSGIQQWGVVHDAFAVPANKAWQLVDNDNPRAMRDMYTLDRVAEWVAGWRADGVPMAGAIEILKEIMGEEGRRPLPNEMLQGLLTLG